MNIFEKVLELQKERERLKNLSVAKEREFREALSAIKQRVNTDRERADKRLLELRELIKDTSKSETLRRVYAAEIEKLETEPPAPTEAEKETLQAAFDEYEKTVKEYATIHNSLKDALSETEKEARKIKESIGGLSGSHPSDLTRFVENDRERMCKFING